MLAWAIGDGDVFVTVADTILTWENMPAAFRMFWNRVVAGDAWLVAHNAGFDRAIWNHATRDFPTLAPEQIIDTRVQAVASGLPPALDAAAKFATGHGKDSAGKDLIKLFTLPDSHCHPGHASRRVETVFGLCRPRCRGDALLV